MHDGKPRVCPRSGAHSCQVQTMVELDSELKCHGCRGPSSKPLVSHSKEISATWLRLAKSFQRVWRNAWYYEKNPRRMEDWFSKFIFFQKMQWLNDTPRAVVLYNPLERNGFLTDVQVNSLSPNSECGICQLSLLEDDPVALPCHHKYHLFCINAWLSGASLEKTCEGKNTCPICRREWNLCRALDAGFTPGGTRFSHRNYGDNECDGDESDDDESGDDESDDDYYY
ncbi:uncharacterized protein BP5553_06536 [Venustampulla echinocandica]|uniref:RING-type domain-containing protein n=1 Tax=Venustampulla echinocandica TaxID=2656787 RepID=A0A370TK81_9HELO|nr:uncharacterized protein BP5553_06536 [Venustampulla echinocandica]RDL35924.1 hypothetical protein BP5553_06536 [Venustampulla echinocandica]